MYKTDIICYLTSAYCTDKFCIFYSTTQKVLLKIVSQLQYIFEYYPKLNIAMLLIAFSF